jgi:hypothetical protein
MFSIARSRYSTFVNLGFLVVNVLGFLFGMVYNMNTPDLYENNAHHKIGWIFSSFALVWVVLGLVRNLTGPKKSVDMSYQPLAQQGEEHPRWSDDSGRATLRNMSIGSVSPGADSHLPRDFSESLPKIGQDEERSRSRLDSYVGGNLAKFISGKTISLISFFYVFFERALILMSFIAITTGFVTFGGIFVSIPFRWLLPCLNRLLACNAGFFGPGAFHQGWNILLGRRARCWTLGRGFCGSGMGVEC